MKTNTSFSILIWVNSSRIKDDHAPLYARITVNLVRVNLSLKRRIKVSLWDSKKAKVKGNSQEARALNNYIQSVRNKLYEARQELLLEGQFLTAQGIKARFLGEDSKQSSMSELIDFHNSKSEGKLHKDTLRHYRTTQKYIREFIRENNKSDDIYLNKLNYEFITRFEHFLRTYGVKKKTITISNNTVMKHLQRLRKMVTMAFHLEWIDKDPFIKFKSSFEKKERCFLSEIELKKVEEYSTDIKRLELVKDLFVFSCYTGISYIDLTKLTPQHLVHGIDGNMWIITKREKTKTPVRFPLLPVALALVQKYEKDPRIESKGVLFPVLSNQKINSYLKEIADGCAIHKNLTFHVARHTFATTVTLSNGVPIETVSKILGHTKLATTQIYARVLEKKVSEDMNVLVNVLNKQQNKLNKGKRLISK